MPTTKANYKEASHSFDIPVGASQDDIADMLRAILSTKAIVRKVVFEVTTGQGRQGKMSVDMLTPNIGPPDGDILEPDPENLWQMMNRIPLSTPNLKKVKMRVPAVMRSVALIMQASLSTESEARIPVGWMINEDPTILLKWLGLRLTVMPSVYMNLPLLRVPFIEKDCLVLLCARSRRMDPILSERGLVLQMEI